MIAVGQYVRAVLAEGLAASLPSVEGFEPQLDREGVAVELRPTANTFVLEDFFGNEHVCHLGVAVTVDPATLDPYLHDWATARAGELTGATT